LRVGIIAPEYPPTRGGMQVVALELSRHLSELCDVTVFTTARSSKCKEAFRLIPEIVGQAETDLAILKRHRVDVWFAMNAAYAAIAPELPTPMVAYFHGNDFLAPWAIRYPTSLRIANRLPWTRNLACEMKREIGRARVQAGMHSLAHIVTNSANTRQLIESSYVQLPAITLCPPGLNPRFFQEPPSSKRSSIRLLSVTRLNRRSRRKNIAGVLLALAKIKKTIEFEYHVVGSGDDRHNLELQVSRLGLKERVKFTGSLSDDELISEYGAADLFVLPVKASTTDVEGFGLVYIEANASGVPVLCSVEGGATDAVVDGETGILIRSSEPDDIASGILEFIAKRTIFSPLRIRSFAEGFRWPSIATRIMSILDGVVESQAPRLV